MLMGMVYMGDHVCGADFNPAVTLGVALRFGTPAAGPLGLADRAVLVGVQRRHLGRGITGRAAAGAARTAAAAGRRLGEGGDSHSRHDGRGRQHLDTHGNFLPD